MSPSGGKLSRLRPITTAVRPIALATIVVVALVATAYPGRLEYLLLDLRFWVTRQTAISSDSAAPDTILLRITTATEEAIGTRFGPAWRSHYPAAIERLADAGARAVVWDAAFVSTDDADADLRAALSKARALPVIAAERSGARTAETLTDAFAAIGWMELSAVDGVPRRALSQPDRPSLGAVAHAVAVGLPAATSEERWIDYSGDPLAVRSFDLAALLAAGDERLADEAQTPLSVFTGRTVFIGVDMEGVDRLRIPAAGTEAVAGVYAQIASYASYASARPIRPVGRWGDAAIAAIGGAALFLGATARTRAVRGLTPVVAAALTIVAPIVVFAAWRLWVPQGGLVIATAASFALAATVRRFELAKSYRESLGFDPALIERRLGDVGVGEAGIERDATVLCADVRGYTQLVSDHDSATVFTLMSRYMREMEAIIEYCGGYINKYIGDEIVAVFGFPLDERDHENRAVAAAHSMLEKLVELRSEWSVTDLPLLDGVGIGLDTGPVRFVRVGGRNRVQFDIIGSAINGASRFQSLTKEHGTPLIVSAEVAERQSALRIGEPHGPDNADDAPMLRFAGEALIRGQGRRRLYDLHAPGISLRYA